MKEKYIRKGQKVIQIREGGEFDPPYGTIGVCDEDNSNVPYVQWPAGTTPGNGRWAAIIGMDIVPATLLNRIIYRARRKA